MAPSNDSVASVNYKATDFCETCNEYFSTRQEFVIVCTGKAAAKCRKAVELFLRLEFERPAGFARLACLAKLTWVGMPRGTLLHACTKAIIYGWTVTIPRVGNQVLHLKPATNKSGLHREVNAASGNDSLASVNYEDAAFWETCDEYVSTNREFVIVCTGKAAARCRKAVEFSLNLERSSPKGLERLTFLVQWVSAMRVSPLWSICDKATVQGWRVTVRRIEDQVVHLAPPSESATDVRRGG